MLNKNEAYLCLSAMLRAREVKLLSSEKAMRMVDSSSFEEAAKMLIDCGYEDMSTMNVKEIEKALTNHRSEIFYELERIAPDRELVDFFKIKYDYHNAKVVLKSSFENLNADNLLLNSGRISGTELKELFLDEKYSSMPGMLGQAITEAKTVFAHTTNPQSSDFVLDQFYLNEVLNEADKMGNAFLMGYAKLLIDAANLKGVIRTKRMGKDSDFLKTVLVKGGSVDVDRIISTPDKEGISALYAHSKLERAANLGVETLDGGSLTSFELECDNAVNDYLKGAKLVSFGPEPLTAYLAAVETEITAIRMILTGRKAGVRSEILKERLRDMYA